MFKRTRKRELLPGYTVEVSVEGRDANEVMRVLEIAVKAALITARDIPRPEVVKKKSKPCGCSGS